MSALTIAWIGAKQAKAQYGIPHMTLVRWYRDGCPALGRKLRTKPQENRGPTGGPKLLVSVADLERIADLATWNGEHIDAAGEKWISSSRAEQTYQLSRDRLNTAKANGQLRGKRIEVGARGRYGCPRKWVWHEADLVKLATTQADPDWLNAEKVADRYGYSWATLYKWTNKGCPFLGGRKLRSRIGPPTGRGKHPRQYSKADLDRISEQYKTDPQATADPDWLTYREAIAEYGVRLWELSEWAREGCKQLGRRLATRKALAGVGNRPMKVIKYSRADLERIVEGGGAKPSRKLGELNDVVTETHDVNVAKVGGVPITPPMVFPLLDRLANGEKSIVIQKAKNGRKVEYSRDAWRFAQDMRKKEPNLTAEDRRQRCIEKYGNNSVPEDDRAFRSWESHVTKT